MKNNHRPILIAAMLLLTGLLTESRAQRADIGGAAVVQPLAATTLRPVLCDVYLFGSGSYSSHKNLWTANNGFSAKRTYATFINAGVETEVYRNTNWRLVGVLGYKYQRYAYDAGLASSEGVFSHWLTADVNLNWTYFCAGMLTDVYLDSYTKNPDHLSYEGLNSRCFNKASLAWYVGASLRFTRMKAEARIGSYIKTQLNPYKIAYYNLHKSEVDRLFWEVRLSYRLFTSGKHYHSGGILE